MDLKDYYKDCESKYKSDKDNWKERADECIKETADYVIREMKSQISLQVERNRREIISGKSIHIRYNVKKPYNNYYPRFDASQSNDSNSVWIEVNVNNEEEALYCRDKLKLKLDSVGLKTSVKSYGYGLLNFDSLRQYMIYYRFIP